MVVPLQYPAMAKYLIIAVVFVGIAIWIVGWVMNPGDDETITGKESVPAATAQVEPLLEGDVLPAVWTASDRPDWVTALPPAERGDEARISDLMKTDVITGLGLKPARLYVNAENWTSMNDLERQTIGQMALKLALAAGSTETSLMVLPAKMIDVPQNEWKPLGQISAP